MWVLPEIDEFIVVVYIMVMRSNHNDRIIMVTSDDPVKRWIGREVKRFLHEADQHLPFLLTLSSGAIDLSADTADGQADANGVEEMD